MFFLIWHERSGNELTRTIESVLFRTLGLWGQSPDVLCCGKLSYRFGCREDDTPVTARPQVSRGSQTAERESWQLCEPHETEG